MDKISIAIDGPAAAGKSTVAKIVAEQLNYIYIDTGAMYRSLTLEALNKGIDLEDENELVKSLENMTISLKPGKDGQLVYINGRDVTSEIRSAAVTANVSTVSKHPRVRKEMVRRQQLLAASGGVVMDGRDIGTHVLPNAEVKVFLLASAEERARRRYLELTKKGEKTDFEKLKQEIEARDKQDMERETAPLKKAEDAVEIDTTSKTIDEVVENILAIVKERIG